MENFNNWSVLKNDDYQFFDSTIREWFEIGGVSVFLHKYIGTINQGNQGDASQPGAAQTKSKGLTEIQDLFFQENRDRSYDPYVYELKAVYNLLDSDFNVLQFGLMLESDTYFLSFHLNEVIEKIGRKLMPGDVLEMLHLRDDALLDDNQPAINKFYQITDVNRASIGWSATWRPHILRAKISPLTDSQQFSQIMNLPANDQVGGDGLYGTGTPGLAGLEGIDSTSGTDGNVATDTTISDLVSDFRTKLAMSEAIEQEAELNVPYRNFDSRNIWIVPGSERGFEQPWIFTGDGVPPNSSIQANSGTEFPSNPQENDYFLMLQPTNGEIDVNRGVAVLYQYINGLWLFQEVDLRLKWQAAHRILYSFLVNNNITTIEGNSFVEKQPLSKVLTPKADY